MSRVVLSIGSNLGDRHAHLQSVVEHLRDALTAVSPVYTTPPWGGVAQGDFLNAVVIAEHPGTDAHGWLHRGQQCERAAGRTRGARWGPRTLDVDVVSVTDGDGREVRIDDAELTVPHPLAHRRAFVLVPWLAVEPAAQLTVGGRRSPVATLVEHLDAGQRSAVRRHHAVLVARRGRVG